jgi:integrase
MSEPTKKSKTRRVGQVIERGERKYQIRIFIGYRPDGKNNYFYKTFNGTKTEAEKWLREALSRRDRGEPLEDPNVTFAELVKECLHSKRHELRARTKEMYDDNLRLYILPTFQDVKIADITPRAVQKWINDLVDADHASSTIHTIYSHFRVMVKYAFDSEMITKYPLKKIKLPKKTKRKPNVLAPGEALKVLDAARVEPNGIYAAFLLWSGCRPNEGAALMWSDVDWKNGAVTIQRNLVRLRGGKWEFGPVKSDAGNRTIDLPASFMHELKEHRQTQLKQRLSVGECWQDYDLVFPDPIGEPITRFIYTTIWKNVLTRAGVSEERQAMRPYDSRHSMATLMLMQRVPTKVVSSRLGHSKESITTDIYQHVLREMDKQATSDLEAAILGAKKGK